MTEEYLRIWAELDVIRARLCYCPTDKALLRLERTLSEQLQEIEQEQA